MEFEIRQYNAADHDRVVSLWGEVFAGDPAWNESAAMILRKMAVQPELFFLAIQNERIVGTVMAGYDGVRGWIHRLAVTPTARRQGVARRLMEAAEEGLQKMNCPKINLQVREGNTEVIQFYRKLGYSVEPHVSMAKRLE